MRTRSLLIALFLVGLANVALAQEINAGAIISFPSGGTLFGVSGRFEAPIENNFKWMITPSIQFGSATVFAIQGGAKYEFEDVGVYIGAELGPLFGSANGSSDTRFAFTPTFGYRFDQKWDISLQYFAASGINFVGFRFAYIFKPGN